MDTSLATRSPSVTSPDATSSVSGGSGQLAAPRAAPRCSVSPQLKGGIAQGAVRWSEGCRGVRSGKSLACPWERFLLRVHPAVRSYVTAAGRASAELDADEPALVARQRAHSFRASAAATSTSTTSVPPVEAGSARRRHRSAPARLRSTRQSSPYHRAKGSLLGYLPTVLLVL
jgi:hypothetical protein